RPGFAAAPEKTDQIDRARADQAMGPDMALCVECAQDRPEPLAAALARELLHPHPYAPVFPRRTAGEVHLDRLEHRAPTEGRPRRTAEEQPFVHVVMQNLAEALEIEPRERAAELLHQRIADRIRMADPLA